MRGNFDSSSSVDHLEQADHAVNGAPAGEPEVWDEAVQEFNPRFGHGPKPEPVQVSPTFDVADYLAGERAKDLLRFSTAGSVDDGKSTLIGRLLYDTQSIYDDQVKSIEGKGTTAPGVLDLALLTDGLRAEREQGITIDVAYRYFATVRRKFIIADTPGHEQYTRNMATGASTADVAVVLVDARKGVLKQSRRHASITGLLGVPQIIVAVNKMDLVDWSESVFGGICEEFTRFFGELDFPAAAALHFVPVSALTGDNVVRTSTAMPWYSGPTLLKLLEELPSSAYRDIAAPFRFPVQRVARPNLDFRGFAGQIAAGTVRRGDEVLVLPSGLRSRVARIVTFDGDLEIATAPLSVTLTLADEIDISRGDVLVAPQEAGLGAARVATRFDASLVWMSAVPLDFGRRYLLKQASRTAQAHVRALHRSLDFSGDAAGAVPLTTLGLNDIGLVAVETLLPLSVDLYEANRHTGSFILIDAETNATVAAGMVRAIDESMRGGAGKVAVPVSAVSRTSAVSGISTISGISAVSVAERVAAWGHGGALLTVAGDPAFADAIERALFASGAFVVRSEDGGIASLGVLAVSQRGGGEGASLTVDAGGQTCTEVLSRDVPDAVAQAFVLLRAMGVLIRAKTGMG